MLIRHSVPEIRVDLCAREWTLGSDGIDRARRFATQIDPGSARAVFSSTEPKAEQTARVLGGAWTLPVETMAGIHEHERPDVGIVAPADFDRRVGELFAQPAACVFGMETGDQARRRFTRALMPLLAHETGDVIVVTHGTVMTLFVSEVTGVEPFAFWKHLALPCAVTLSLPDLRIMASSRLPA
jgi:broad specificity phosphatase PhoE